MNKFMIDKMRKNKIAVTGCLTKLPMDFPLVMPENSGNMIHAQAPLSMFKGAVYARDNPHLMMGYNSFKEFVNKECSHLIVTFANTLKVNEISGERFAKTLDFLRQFECKIIVFGLGIQAKTLDLEDAKLPNEAIELLRFLSDKATYLGVRGESTKLVVEKNCGINNVFVTGCPSIFSGLKSFDEVRQNLKYPRGRPAFSATRFFEDIENKLFLNAFKSDYWLIEPVNKFNHEFYLKSCINNVAYEDVPYFLKKLVDKKDTQSVCELQTYFQKRYRLFRDVESWVNFNKEFVSFAYGTRFHANMAALISGKPALWITHDQRTRELTEYMKLPAISIEDAINYDFSEPLGQESYEQFFENFPKLLANFNHYLESNGLVALSA